MACFLVSAAFGIFTTALRKKFPKEMHIDWLNMMIFGSTVAFGVEHVIKGEIVPWFPFLTAMENPTAFGAMLNEIWAIGVPMMLATVFAWAIAVLAYGKFMAPATRAKALNGS